MKVKKSKVAYIGEDILSTCIFPLLPITSLYRFKCVCKSWLRIISDHPILQGSYSLAHVIKISDSPENLLYDLLFPSKYENSFRFSCDYPIYIHTSKSCNGLLYAFFEGGIYVINPATGEKNHVSIPNNRFCVGLAFDPTKSSYYKLVCIYIDAILRKNRFEVYSSETSAWSLSKAQMGFSYLSKYHSTSVFASGVLFWDEIGTLHWFHLDKDLAGVAQYPNNNKPSPSTMVFGEWHGMVTFNRITKEDIEIWVMTEFRYMESKCQWTKRFSVSLNKVVSDNLHTFEAMELRNGRAVQMIIQRHWRFHEALPYWGGDLMWTVWNKRYHAEDIFFYDINTGKLRCIHTHMDSFYFLYKKVPHTLQMSTCR